jgi:twinkle protein
MFQWLRGEFMVVTGIPSHGKSVFVENCIVQLAKVHDWKFGVWIAESDPEISAINKVQLITGQPVYGENKLPKELFKSTLEFINSHFFYFNIDEKQNTLDQILAKGEELVRRKGIDCLYIDPWSYVEKDRGRMTDNEYFESCLPKIKRFRKHNDCMVIVVAHPRKIEMDQKTSKMKVPGPYDISGSNQWYGAPDKIISVYCNYDEEKKPESHDIHIMKQKKWWLGEKGVVSFKMNKLGVFREYNDSQIDFYNDPKVKQANDRPDEPGEYGFEPAPF